MADYVVNIDAIDHFENYPQFSKEAYRILKPGGKILVASHLDVREGKTSSISMFDKVFNHSFWERLTRRFYVRKYKVGSDDHTYHFSDTKEIVMNMEKVGFVIEIDELIKGNFMIVASKNM
jgi:ubiquinone/menaquinone biosynthesis C-methylase UbiE